VKRDFNALSGIGLKYWPVACRNNQGKKSIYNYRNSLSLMYVNQHGINS